MTKPPCFAISGWKNSGKTSLVAALIREFSARGMRVSAIKHAHHSFDLDQPGTDSHTHREAGASEVMLVSARRWAIQHELYDEAEPSFSDMVARLSPCDLVLVEGYKREPIPRIEVIADGTAGDWLWKDDPCVAALACDETVNDCSLPQFSRSQVSPIADFILQHLGLNS